jgi:hypothetical protein
VAHYYRQDGSPAHFEGKDGRATTLREARKLSLYPSVTTLENILDKPGLNKWKIDQHLETAAANAYENDVSVEEWRKSVRAETRERLDKAPDLGSSIHDALERFSNGESVSEHADAVSRVDILVHEHTGMRLEDFIAEQSFVHPLGFGGCVDLHIADIRMLMDNWDRHEDWVIDYKTSGKGGDDFTKQKLAWPNHCRQLAAYREGLGLPHARVANVFISTVDDSVLFVEWPEEKVAHGWSVFQGIVELWQRINKFKPEEA